MGIDRNNFDTRDLLLQLLRGARDGATGSRGHEHVVQLATRLLDDLLGGAIVVRERVSRVDVLIQNMAVQLLGEARRQEDVRVLSIPGGLGRCTQDLSAKALHGVYLLSRHLLRETDDHLVALQGGSQGEADAGVAAGGLNQHVARLDAAALLRLLDHALANTVLDGASGIEELHLRQQLALDVEELRKARHAHHGREADQVKSRVANLRIRPGAGILADCELHEVRLERRIPTIVGRRRDLALLRGIVRHLRHVPGPSHDWVHSSGERP
mmetsp:Transcript_56339/g.98919  ORF Transcript_56339/g.98919 Transcript_56339/m.98919 type:complete len:270 (-) Transcript_56339:34-843(-)